MDAGFTHVEHSSFGHGRLRPSPDSIGWRDETMCKVAWSAPEIKRVRRLLRLVKAGWFVVLDESDLLEYARAFITLAALCRRPVGIWPAQWQATETAVIARPRGSS